MSHTTTDSWLSIQEVARRTRLSAHTLRYYERIGLLAPVGRDVGGRRRYAARDLDWLAFLMRLRATGMPIARMLAFAELRQRGDATVSARRELLEAHHAAVTAELQELAASLEVIAAKVGHYRRLEEDMASSLQEPRHEQLSDSSKQ